MRPAAIMGRCPARSERPAPAVTPRVPGLETCLPPYRCLAQRPDAPRTIRCTRIAKVGCGIRKFPGDPGRELGRYRGVQAVAVPGPGKVVSGGKDGAVRLWDPEVPGGPERELGRHDGWAVAVGAGLRGKSSTNEPPSVPRIPQYQQEILNLGHVGHRVLGQVAAAGPREPDLLCRRCSGR